MKRNQLGLSLLTWAVILAFTPLMAVLFMWAWSLFAPAFGLPPLDYLASLGIVVVGNILLPSKVLRVDP